MRKKSEDFGAFRVFKAYAEKALGRKIKTPDTPNWRETRIPDPILESEDEDSDSYDSAALVSRVGLYGDGVSHPRSGLLVCPCAEDVIT